MARQQKLIHLHTSGLTPSQSVLLNGGESELAFGEIAVQYNSTEPKLYIRKQNNTLAAFIDSAAVGTLITNAQTTLNNAITGETKDRQDAVAEINAKLGNISTAATVSTRLSDIEAAIGAGQGGEDSLTNRVATLESGLTAETSARETADNSHVSRLDSAEGDITDLKAVLSGLTNSDLTTTQSKAASALQAVCAGTSSTYATVNVTAPSANKQSIGVTLTTKDVTSSTASDNGLALAKDVKDYVTGVNSAMDTRVTSLETFKTNTEALTAGEWGNQTIKQYIDSVSQTATNALKSISSGSPHDYVTVEIGTIDSNQNQTVAVSVTTKAVADATASKQGLADAYDVKTYVNGKDSAMNTRVTSLETDRTALMARTSGFSDTAGSIKTYIDDKVSSEIASVYKVKGSVATYADLPGSNLTVGDVYNVVAESTVGEGANAKTYPAGTNFVYTSNGWDALGGTVDLSPYMLESTFNTYTSSTLSTRLSNIETSITNGDNGVKAIIGGEYTSANTVASAISALNTSASTLNNAITTETSERTAADTDINARIGDGFTSATTGTVAARMTAVEGKASSNETNIGTIESKLGTGVTTANTVTQQLSSISSVADSAIQTITVTNTATNGITATKSGTDVTFNFDNMVIDCGTY